MEGWMDGGNRVRQMIIERQGREGMNRESAAASRSLWSTLSEQFFSV